MAEREEFKRDFGREMAAIWDESYPFKLAWMTNAVHVMTDAAQFLDQFKMQHPESWHTGDQDLRNRITTLLSQYHDGAR